MKVFHAANHPATAADSETFTGAATRASMNALGETPRINMYRVRFEPAARTAWHTHTGPQLLLVIEGSCRIRKAGEPPHEVAAGGAIRVEPGERHWHGATPDAAMTHLALNIDAQTHWYEKVTDDEYAGR